MSDKRQSASSEDQNRNGKLIKYSNDWPQETGDIIPSLFPTPVGNNSEDESVIYMLAKRFGKGNRNEFLMQQQREYLYLQQTLHRNPIREIGTSSQMETPQDPKHKAKLEDIQSNLGSYQEYCPSKNFINGAANPLQLGDGAPDWSSLNYWPPQTLFDVVVPRSNRLPIPYDLASEHFQPSEAPQPPNHLHLYTVHLTDYFNCTWEMKFVCFVEEEAYVVTRGWEEFVDRHDVRHKDTIRFFRENPSSGKNCFKVYHELGAERVFPSPENIHLPQFLPENLLCGINLTKTDIELGNLNMPEVEFPFQCRTHEMVRMSDERDKDWYMIVVQTRVAKKHRIVDGWDSFVREHQLKAGDMVRFYLPVFPEHRKHFLIECVKKKKEKKEEGGSNDNQPDDNAKPSLGGSDKGKETVKG